MKAEMRLIKAISEHKGLIAWIHEHADTLRTILKVTKDLGESGEAFEILGPYKPPDDERTETFLVDVILKVRGGMGVKGAVVSTLLYYKQEGMLEKL